MTALDATDATDPTDPTDTATPEFSLAGLSLAERAALGSGADFWTTKTVGPVPALTLTDGPHGVRLQAEDADHLGISAEAGPRRASRPPSASARAGTPNWSRRSAGRWAWRAGHWVWTYCSARV